jgi:hypothetical protein
LLQSELEKSEFCSEIDEDLCALCVYNSGGTFQGEILPTNSQSGVSWKIPGKQEVLGIKIKDTVVGHDLQGQLFAAV